MAKDETKANGNGAEPPLPAAGGAKSGAEDPLGGPDLKEKMRDLLASEDFCWAASALVLEGYRRGVGKKERMDPMLRALARIAVDADLNAVWRKQLEDLLLEDEDLARKELVHHINNKTLSVDQLREQGATEQEIELAAGHIGLRDEDIFEEEIEFEQKLTYVLKQAEVIEDTERQLLLQVRRTSLLSVSVQERAQ